jgi:flagellar protein FliS
MPINGYKRYFEDEVHEASPVQLVQLLYKGALDSITSARRYLRVRDILARSRAITKALNMVNELSLSLKKDVGGDLSGNLAALYAYVGRLLIRANAEQAEPPLVEAERLLSTLLEGWKACEKAESNELEDQAVGCAR